jgi:hypothetical protein
MWGTNRYGPFFLLLVIGLVFLVLSNSRGFPGWLCICIVPAFPLAFGWSGRRDIFEKRKRDEAYTGYSDTPYEDEKPKRDDPSYALGDDGELIELPPDTSDENTRRPDDYV